MNDDRQKVSVFAECGSGIASLIIDYTVGVSVAERYEVKRVDSDYFEEA